MTDIDIAGPFDGQTTLAEAKEWLLGQIESGQIVRCPCCTQDAKMYQRAITSEGARVLIDMYQTDRQDWVHAASMKSYKGGDAVKPRYWGLIEKMEGTRPDGSTRNGYWRLTDLGRRFVEGTYSPPAWVWTYDEELVAGPSGPPRGIREAVGRKFNYEDLMAGQ